MDWVDAMWKELDELPDTEQFIATGAWITRMTQELLPQLGLRRRTIVLDILAREDWDATRLAEETGSRRTTITRLAEEGRAALRKGES
jgi:hypothetical protein